MGMWRKLCMGGIAVALRSERLFDSEIQRTWCRIDKIMCNFAYYFVMIMQSEGTIGNMSASASRLVEGLKTRYAGGKPVRVLFVCLGNICRSPAAEGVMRAVVEEHVDAAIWVIDSAGTGNYHIGDLPDNRMRIHARRRGYELTHRCRQVCASDFDDFDVVIGMDASNLRNLKAVAPTPEAEAKIVGMKEFFDICTKFDYVPDPYYEGAEGFELVLDLLMSGCANLYNAITSR